MIANNEQGPLRGQVFPAFYLPEGEEKYQEAY
jgi:hypothetical protein